MRTLNRYIPFALGASLMLASCASYHVRMGDQALGLMAYAKAEKHYEKALPHRTDRNLLLHAAEAARKLNETDLAEVRYHAADSIAPLGGDDAFAYGRMLAGMGRYDQASEMFLRVLKERPEDHVALDLLGACQGYRSFYADSARYAVAPLSVNGVATAFSPVPYGNGLLFTGAHATATGKKNPWTGLSYLDLYSVPIGADGVAGTAVPLKGTVDGPFHDGPGVLSPDGRTLYFTRSNYHSGKLLKDQQDESNLKLFRASLNDKGEWGDIRGFAFNSDDYSMGHPALSADGKTLYFVSDMPGGSGGKDIWYSTDNGTGWGAPQNMGSTINSAGDEMFPTVVGDALYFSSTAHNNMGGLDIFETHKEGEYWSEPKNLGYPVNSTHDDFGLWLDSAGTKGYLSSNRSGTDQLYRVEIRQPVFAVEGVVTNASTGAPVPNASITLSVNGRDTVATADNAGHFHLPLSPGTAYTLLAALPGMLAQSRDVSTEGLGISTTLQADIALVPVVIDKPMTVKNIYYDFDQWDIRPDAAVELDKLVSVFKDNPKLTFELSSHTDSRGGDTYNLVLSDMRAKSAVDYLVRKGVNPDRLVARGYGETQLVNGCSNGVPCTEEQHQANRRTEIRVISNNAGTALK